MFNDLDDTLRQVLNDHQMIKDAGFELELASGEAVPADPEAMRGLQRRPSLPMA